MITYTNNDKLFIRNDSEIIVIESWGEDSLRVRATKNYAFSGNDQALMPATSDAAVVIGKETSKITNGRISAVVSSSKPCGVISFLRDGEAILKEYANPFSPGLGTHAREYTTLGGGDFAIKMRFDANKGEKLYGMGQYQQSELNMKGCVLELAPKNAQVSIPFYISNRGYGFLWNNPSIGKVSFGNNYTEWESRRSSEIDYWVTVGDDPKELIKKFTDVVGRAPDFPEDLLGLWQCKLRYRTQEEVLEIAREYHRRSLPLDLIVIDYYHWEHDGDWRFDPTYWPDPAAMTRELAEMGTKCMVSVWPTVMTNSINYKEMNARGLMVNSASGEPCGIFGKPFYDATNPEAREFIWSKVKKNYYDLGIDTFWLDCSEPEFLPPEFHHYVYSVGSAEKTAGLYPLLHVKGFYEGVKSAGEKTPMTLSRSAWVGAQRYGTVVWSGDIRSTFETLRAQLCAGLNVGLAGIPWWTTDTAGFMGNVNDPWYNELLVRWFQFSTFSPVLRLHGYLGPYQQYPRLSENVHSGGYAHTAQPHELWSHGEDVYEILKKYLFIRLELKEYLTKIMNEASENGSPLLRTMFYEFPGDECCWELDDQYMLGSRYLVAPVMYEGMRERDVYLPAGTWKDYHTGELLQGGKRVNVPAPLDIIPVFERI